MEGKTTAQPVRDPAIAFAWSEDEHTLALGYQKPIVTLHDVCEARGDPGPTRATVDWITQLAGNIVFLAFRSDGSLVIVTSEAGWTVCDGKTGQMVRTAAGDGLMGVLDRNRVKAPSSAALSPSRNVLFVARRDDVRTVVHRIDLVTGLNVAVHDLEVRAPAPRAFALDDHVALVEIDADPDDDDGDLKEQGFVRVDFASLAVTRRMFEQRAWDPVTLHRVPGVLAVDVARGVGLRPDFTPIEAVEVNGQTVWPVRLEVFDLETLAAKDTPAVAGALDASLEKDGAEGVRAEPGSDEHRAASETLLGHIRGARFVPSDGSAWVGLRYGGFKKLALTDEDGDEPMIVHRDAEGVTDYAELEKRLGTGVLGVSPSGRYLALGYPNEFRRAP